MEIIGRYKNQWWKGSKGLGGWGGEFAEVILFAFREIRILFERMRKKIEKMRPYEVRKFMSNVQKELNRVRDLHLRDITSDIKGTVDKDLDKKLSEALKEPKFAFFVRAWIPC